MKNAKEKPLKTFTKHRDTEFHKTTYILFSVPLG